MVDFPQPDGPTSATNSPSAMRSVVFDKAGTARAPRPKVTEASDNSMAIGAAPPGTGEPEKSNFGCMRITRKVHASRMPAKLSFQINDIAKSRRTQRIRFGRFVLQTACNWGAQLLDICE